MNLHHRNAANTEGGKVTIPAGNFMSDTIYLKSGVELHLEKGTRLLGSTNRDVKKFLQSIRLCEF